MPTSSTQPTGSFNFLVDYVLRLLADNNIQLTEEQQTMYIPQLLSQVELRLGLELLPKLNELQKNQFAAMTNDTHTTADEWREFWIASVPTFEEDVKMVLQTFAGRVKELLG